MLTYLKQLHSTLLLQAGGQALRCGRHQVPKSTLMAAAHKGHHRETYL
jgi:hypothetical protein